jgi:energy-coupling factor transport system substrate-specific component
VTTSLGFDIPRALLTGALVVAAGPAVLLALRRAARRAAFDAPVGFDTPS